MILVLSLAAVLLAAVVVQQPWRPVTATPQESPSGVRGRPLRLHSVSIDFGVVVDPATDWEAVDRRLDEAGATGVEINAGRVEFTAFDWEAHPESAAEPGTDHIARAIDALSEDADGSPRSIGLIVDAFVPRLIAEDPSRAAAYVDGTPAEAIASATQITRGEVGDRLVGYVAALGERYAPAQIALTEVFFDFLGFGEDDLALFREMTGEQDWPRTATGEPDEASEVVGRWRSEVVRGLLERMRVALDQVRGGEGAEIDLAFEARIDWQDPARGQLATGQDYATLLTEADRLVLWAYLYPGHTPAEVEQVTAALAGAGYDMSRFTISVGLWAPGNPDPPGVLPVATVGEAVVAAETNGVTDVNVTPYTLMGDAYWAELARVWGGTRASGAATS